MTRNRVLTLGPLSALFPLALSAQSQLSWTQMATSGPPSRSGTALAFDSQRARTVLFGGSSITGYLNDTWEWNGQVWTAVAGTGPSPRSGHALAFDSGRGRIVLFGGQGSAGNVGDTWEWDGGLWTLMASSGPTPRRLHGLAYDSLRGRCVLFGGIDNNGYLADTWEWNGSLWLPQLFAAGPQARAGHALAFDSQRARTVLFGGADGSSHFGDTWEWNGAWQLVNPIGPGARRGHAIAYDSARATVVLFGGSNGTNTLGDTWERTAGTWTLASPAGPSARAFHALAFDSQRGRTVLFGGDAGTFLGDTWERHGSLSSANPFGSGCGNPALRLMPVTNARPAIHTTAQLALTNVPSSLAFVALGWSRTAFGVFPLPLTLAGFGMPGCDLLQSSEVSGLPATVTGPGAATFSLALPDNPGLIGLRVYLQGWAQAPGANAGNAISSNAVEWVIGDS